MVAHPWYQVHLPFCRALYRLPAMSSVTSCMDPSCNMLSLTIYATVTSPIQTSLPQAHKNGF